MGLRRGPAHAISVCSFSRAFPGPDFAVTVKNTVAGGRRAGLLCALGVTLANGLHISGITWGLGAWVNGSRAALIVLQVLAAGYLGYLGSQAIRSKPRRESPDGEPPLTCHARSPFIEGLMVNALNGKAILFWLGFLTLILKDNLHTQARLAFVMLLLLTLFIWFALVATLLSRRTIREQFLRKQILFNRAMGLVLLALSTRVLATLLT